jgi:hypothetical protein
MQFLRVMFIAQLSYNFYTTLTTFFKINHWIFRKINPMVDHKKKKKKLLELYNNHFSISKCDGMHIWAKIIMEILHRILM